MLTICLQFLKLKIMLSEFYNCINRQHKNIKSIIKTEKKPSKLLFLDVLVRNKPNLVTFVYRKPTYTGLLATFFVVLHLLNRKVSH